MPLHYLDFDITDEDSGRCSFDAMASVFPERLPDLLAELAAVLRWAIGAFGVAGALEGEGDWDYELGATGEPDTPLDVVFDRHQGVRLAPWPKGPDRTTLTLTLSGSPAFAEAFRRHFGIDTSA